MESDPKTIRNTTLACGTSLADIPPTASLYLVEINGDVVVLTNSYWDIAIHGESSPGGPSFQVTTSRERMGHPRHANLYADRLKAYERASVNAGATNGK